MPITGDVKVTKPVGNREWKPVPEDIYQVVVKDIMDKDVRVFGGAEDELESKYLFKYVILDHVDDPTIHKQMLTDFVYPKWFSGDSKKKLSPSKLITIFKSIYGFYFPDTKVEDIPEDQVTDQVNQLIGSQVRIAVKVKEDESNKITDYLVIKEELEVPEDVKIAEIKEKASGENPKSSEEFIKSLEDDKKVEDMSQEELDKTFATK